MISDTEAVAAGFPALPRRATKFASPAVGGDLAAQRLSACGEWRGKRATYNAQQRPTQSINEPAIV